MITVNVDNNKNLIIPNEFKNIVVQSEVGMDTVKFIVDRYYNNKDLSAFYFYLKIYNAGGMFSMQLMAKSVKTQSVELSYGISDAFTYVSGLVRIQLEARTSSGLQWLSKTANVHVDSSLNAAALYPATEALFDSILNQIHTYLQEIENSAKAAADSASSASEKAEQAGNSAASAADSASAAASSADKAKTDTDMAMDYANAAAESAGTATSKAAEASYSAMSASDSAELAALSADKAKAEADRAKTEADNVASIESDLSEKIETLDSKLTDITEELAGELDDINSKLSEVEEKISENPTHFPHIIADGYNLFHPTVVHVSEDGVKTVREDGKGDYLICVTFKGTPYLKRIGGLKEHGSDALAHQNMIINGGTFYGG